MELRGSRARDGGVVSSRSERRRFMADHARANSRLSSGSSSRRHPLGRNVRIFVTGATGFIGSHFVNHALSAGHEVVALRRSADSIPRIAPTRNPAWLTGSLKQVTERDLAEVDVVV